MMIFAVAEEGWKGEPMEHKQPYCFRCEQFYREKGKRFPTAHCTFETYEKCPGRLRGEKPERKTDG